MARPRFCYRAAEPVIATARKRSWWDSGLWFDGYAAWADDRLGHRDRALDQSVRASEIDRTLTAPTLVMMPSNAGLVRQFRREFDTSFAEETGRIADPPACCQRWRPSDTAVAVSGCSR